MAMRQASRRKEQAKAQCLEGLRITRVSLSGLVPQSNAVSLVLKNQKIEPQMKRMKTQSSSASI
jgi:hypothetical protein